MTVDLAITKFLDFPQKLVEYMEQTRDLHEGVRVLQTLNDIRVRTDSIMSIVLPPMEKIYEDNPPVEFKGLSFTEAMVRATGLAEDTIKNHTRVGRVRLTAPEEIQPVFDRMPFKSKIQISDTVENGYDLTLPTRDIVTGEEKSGWQAVADAYYNQQVALQLHEIKGTQPRNQFCKWDVDDETATAITTIGRIVISRREHYDNPETEDKASWAWAKMKNKLER